MDDDTTVGYGVMILTALLLYLSGLLWGAMRKDDDDS